MSHQYNGGINPSISSSSTSPRHTPPPPPPPPPPSHPHPLQPTATATASATDDPVYKDPSNLLNVYPFLPYSPTARVAEHLAPHTVTYLPPSSSSTLYPQYTDTFNRIDRPSSVEDWAMRQAAEARLREVLVSAGQGYTQQLPLTPQYAGPPTPVSLAPDHSQINNSRYPLPLPYNFLPSTSQYQQRLPTSDLIPPAAEFFDNFISETLTRSSARQSQTSHTMPVTTQSSRPASPAPSRPSMSDMRNPHPSSSVTSTPTHDRVASSPALSSSPDILGLPGPSPSKKHKSSKYRDSSPTLASSKNFPQDGEIGLSSLSMREERAGSISTLTAKPKTKRVVEVEIVSRRKALPNKVKNAASDEDESDEDELGWSDDADGDEDWDMNDDFTTPKQTSVVPQSSGRTGERDTRSSWQKLQTLFEDINDEADSFPANLSAGDLAGSRFFASTSKTGSALLSIDAISKLSQYLTRAQGSRRRQRSSTSGNGESEWDVNVLNKIFGLLERSMRDADNLNIFPEDKKVTTGSTGSKLKDKKKRSKTSKEQNPAEDESSHGEDAVALTNEIVLKQEESMRRMMAAVAAAECCFILLDSEGLSKQVYSEDLLSTCITTVKNQMEKIIFPVIEGLAGSKMHSQYLAHVVHNESVSPSRKTKSSKSNTVLFDHPIISSIAQYACAAIPRITSLISKPDLTFSDSLVIQTVYLAIAPLFINEPVAKKSRSKDVEKQGGMSVMKSLRVEALGCLRGAFARYEAQRQWVIEEILSSLARVPEQNHAQSRFQLANGRSIHTISALLLQIIQASTYGVSLQVRKIHAANANSDIEMGASPRKAQVDLYEEEARICADAMESALRSARVVATYLVQKSTSTKATKTSHDAEYKAILDLFVNDVLNVLYQPEWPAASIYINVISRILINALEDTKSSPEATSAKGLALDYLGDIAAKLKQLQLDMQGEAKMISAAHISGNAALLNAHAAVSTFLAGASRDDASFACSRDMATIVYAQELQAAIQKGTSVIEQLVAEKGEEAQDTSQRLQNIVTALKNTLRNVWMADVALFEVNDPKAGEVASQASLAVSRGRPLQNAVDPILHALLGIMDNPAVGLRSKALRSVGSVIVVDPEVLALPQIRQALEERLSDPSPAVRDAAVELVGKYLVQKPKLAAEYYPHIAMRIMDTGLGVRKRVIKLLRGLFSTLEDKEMRVDICCNIIGQTDDTDEGVKELATKTFTSILYPAEGSANDTAELLVDILGDFKGLNVVLEHAIDGVAKESEGAGHPERFGQTIDALITRLVDATEQTEFDSLSHIRAIWLLCASNPSQIDTAKAGVLLSYLRPPANADDQAANELLLRIFRTCIPDMPRSASTFAQDLTKALMPMINKPSGGFQALRETIGCFCAVTQYLTRDYTKLLNVLRACEGKIRMIRKQVVNGDINVASSQPAAMMLYITALIAEGCNLDQIAQEDGVVKLEIRKISHQPLSEHLFETFLDFAKLPTAQTAPTICLGSLYRTYPGLLQRTETTEWMQSTFDSTDMDNRARLLGVIHEFLASEVKKRATAATPKKDVNLLIGSAKELQESDYSTTIVQNNIEQIFDCARSQHSPTQNAALDILTFVVNQGLYSPVHTVPILVTLETSSDPSIAERALALHSVLHSKHASLVTVHYMESAKASYDYQLTITAEPSGHRQGVALLQPWYTLLSEKRAWRHDFLKAICRGFDKDVESDIDSNFVLYLAENLCTFEYKLQEEPMTIINCLNKIISTCTHLATILEDAIVSGDNDEYLDGKVLEDGSGLRVDRVFDASLVVGLAVLVKNHLLDLYHLPEDKCTSHVPGKKSTVGDKPVTKRGLGILDSSRMPLTRMGGIKRTVADFREQQATFLSLLHEDGSLSDH